MKKQLKEFIRFTGNVAMINCNGLQVAVILEGRDSAGKSATIKYLTKYLNPKLYRTYPSKKPTKRQMEKWLSTWAIKMPAIGKINFYDRSYYSRALIQPVMGWCSEKQYKNFIKDVQQWEDKQTDILFLKFWLSIDRTKQDGNLKTRKNSPLHYWKFSNNDKYALDNFDKMTLYKTQLFEHSKNWNKIDFNNKTKGKQEILKIINEAIENFKPKKAMK